MTYVVPPGATSSNTRRPRFQLQVFVRSIVRSAYGCRPRSAALRIGIEATSRRRWPWKERTAPVVALAASIRKWRGPLSTTAVAPSSRASAPASKAFHHVAGQRFRPIVFHTVAVAVGGAPRSSRISQ